MEGERTMKRDEFLWWIGYFSYILSNVFMEMNDWRDIIEMAFVTISFICLTYSLNVRGEEKQ